MKLFIKCCGGCISLLLWVTTLVAQPEIIRVEYYIDSDPGYDKGNSLSFAADTNLSNISFKIKPSAITNGVHIIGIRAKDANGVWSPDNKWLFAKPYPNAAKAGAAPNIFEVEYYIDKDPGYGKGVPVAINNANNLANISVSVNISGLLQGDHNLFVRSKDAKNIWNIDNVIAFTVGTTAASPSIIVNSIARKKLCLLDSVDVSYEAKGTYFPGNIFNVELSDADGNFTEPTTIGSFIGTVNSIIKCGLPAGLPAGTGFKLRVNSTNPVVIGLPVTDSVKISSLPAPVIIPSDTIIINQGDSITLATTIGYKSYLWSNSAKTAPIQVKKYGAYTVKVTDNNGCSATSAPVQVNVTPLITASGPILNLCPGTPVKLTSSVADSYLWNTHDTTQSIEITTSGAYYVEVNGRGKGEMSATVSVTYTGCDEPGLLSATNITDTAATLNWAKVKCAEYYLLHYRIAGTGTWNTIQISDSGTSYNISGLSASTTYEWEVSTGCSVEPPVVSDYSSTDFFTTGSVLIAGNPVIASRRISSSPVASDFKAILFPNPATRSTTLQVKGSNTKVSVLITDIAGKILLRRDKITANFTLPLEDFSAGIYLVIIKDGNHQQTIKLVKN